MEMGPGRWRRVEALISLIGEVTVIVRDKRGRFVGRWTFRNTITNYARAALAQWLAAVSTNATGLGTPVLPPDRIALGTGSGTPGTTDAALFAETAGTRKICSIRQVYGSYYSQFIAQYQTSDPRGTFTEAGLFDAAGNLWAHVMLNLTLITGQIATIQWKVQIKAG